MSSKNIAIGEAQADMREHTQGILLNFGSLAQEASGGSELREMLMKAAKQTVTLDTSIRDTKDALGSSQANVIRLSQKTDETSEQWRHLAKTIDIVKITSGQL